MIKSFIENNIKGDKYLWAFIMALILFSFLPVYSASSNLVYVAGNGTVITHMIKHGSFLVVGLSLILLVQNVNYKYFGGFAVLLFPVACVLLVFTLMQGQVISGANASRWLSIPGIPIKVQTSTIASLLLLVYLARYLTLIRNKPFDFWHSFRWAILPILATVGLIFPANGSTAFILFVLSLTLLFIGNYPIKYLSLLVLVGGGLATLFVYLALQYGDQFPSSRVHTWQNRIENFRNADEPESYQVKHAKAAIVQGGVFGKGWAKSAFKQTLPQSSSDFIFAVIIEEYGLAGGLFLAFMYLLVLFRIIIIATKIHTYFGTLLVLAAGLPIILQAFINMGVAVSLFPVTGQPLPLISYGGTSLWITCIALGIVLSVSRQIKSKEEIEAERRKLSEELIQDIA